MKKIIYIGQFTDASGYANAARKYLEVLHKFLDHSRYNLRIYNSSYEGKNHCSDYENNILQKYLLQNEDLESYIKQKDYTVIIHLLPTDYALNFPTHKNKIIYDNAKERINLSYWEADRIPRDWRKIFSDGIYDKLILGCDWNKEIYSKDCSTKTYVIPIPKSNIDIQKEKNEKFTIFSMSQWQYRKGFDLLIKAFYQEFFNHEDAKLFIKTYRTEASGGDVNTEKKAIFEEANSYKKSVVHYNETPKCRLEIMNGVVSNQEIINLYKKADVFCLPTRGEGFGLTIADASMYGVPCIIPDIGGHLDFVDKDNCFLIESRYKPVENLNPRLYSSNEMNTVECDLLSLRKNMKLAYYMWKTNPQQLLNMGEKSKDYTRKILDEKEIFIKFMKALEDR